MQRFIVGIIGIAAVVFVFFSMFGSKLDLDLSDLTAESTATPTAPVTPVTTGPAPEAPAPAPATEQGPLQALDTVTVTPATRIPDYDRDLFGNSWEDVDGNSCDTRNDILARDLEVTSKEDHCKVLTGTLADPYTGQTIPFTRGQDTSADVQIDHIHSLSGAWKAGAYAWSEEQRVAFANDPANLLAVDGPANSRKSDKGPAAWLPSMAGNAAYDCTYAATYTDILVKYNLTAPAEDIQSLRSVLSGCN